MNKKKTFGDHYLVEFIGCCPDKMNKTRQVREVLLRAAEKSKATILKSYFHQFKPNGVSGVILIAESHFSIHTWPEDNYAAFDILTCGKMYPQRAINEIKKAFEAKKILVKKIPRGI